MGQHGPAWLGHIGPLNPTCPMGVYIKLLIIHKNKMKLINKNGIHFNPLNLFVNKNVYFSGQDGKEL